MEKQRGTKDNTKQKYSDAIALYADTCLSIKEKTVSSRSAAKYAEALHLYETTSEPLKSIARRLGLTYNSIGGFIRRNYPEAIAKHNALLVSNESRMP